MYYAGDITGKQYGEWTVLRKYEGSKHNNSKWVCRCSCGVEKPVLTYALVHGISKNCGSPLHLGYIGRRYGKLVVLPKWKHNKNRLLFLCKCDCGVEKYIPIYHLEEGAVISCGCSKRKHFIPGTESHKMSNTRIYHIWLKMKERCTSENCRGYKNYGGRGISICKEWEIFENFYDWAMENGYADDLSIDRIDVNGNYEPSNCRWATPKIQANNTRVNVYVDYNGEHLTLTQVYDKYSENCVSLKLFWQRYRRDGWSIEEALKTPPKQNRKLQISLEKERG